MRNLMAMLTALLFGVATGGAGVVVLKGLFGEWGAFLGLVVGLAVCLVTLHRMYEPTVNDKNV